MVDAAFVFAALDEPHDGIRQPIGQRHRVRAAKGEDGVGVANAEKPARAGKLVAEGNRLQPEPLPAAAAGSAVVGDIRGVGEVKRVGAIEDGSSGWNGSATPLIATALADSINTVGRLNYVRYAT